MISDKVEIQVFIKIAFIAINLLNWLILDYCFEQPHAGMLSGISAVISFGFVPRNKSIDSQNGKSIQMKWIFYKKPYYNRLV